MTFTDLLNTAITVGHAVLLGLGIDIICHDHGRVVIQTSI
jgi:hypothetical protein